jgi:flagellar biosynthesis/type III secretory pathway M-ring protein FliF/YscJ
MDVPAGSGAENLGSAAGDVLPIGQEAAFLGAWDFVLLALLAIVLLWVLPRRLLRAARRQSQQRAAAAGKCE